MLILILQRQEDISSRLGNLERHLSSSNHHLPLNIPHQSYTPYLPSIIPLILLIHLIHHYLLILYPHPLYLHVIKLTTLQHQHLQKKTYKTYYNNLAHLHLHLQLHLHAPYTLRARYVVLSTDSILIHKHRLYNVETILKRNRYLVTKHNSPATQLSMKPCNDIRIRTVLFLNV